MSNTLVAAFELPGLSKEDISIELHPNHRLTVLGEHKAESVAVPQDTNTDPAPTTEIINSAGIEATNTEDKPHQSSTTLEKASASAPSEPYYYVRERKVGKFERTITVPEGTKV